MCRRKHGIVKERFCSPPRMGHRVHSVLLPWCIVVSGYSAETVVQTLSSLDSLLCVEMQVFYQRPSLGRRPCFFIKVVYRKSLLLQFTWECVQLTKSISQVRQGYWQKACHHEVLCRQRMEWRWCISRVFVLFSARVALTRAFMRCLKSPALWQQITPAPWCSFSSLENLDLFEMNHFDFLLDAVQSKDLSSYPATFPSGMLPPYWVLSFLKNLPSKSHEIFHLLENGFGMVRKDSRLEKRREN